MKTVPTRTRCFGLADGVRISVVEETVIDVHESCGLAWLSGSKRPSTVTVQIGDVSHTFQIDPEDPTLRPRREP